MATKRATVKKQVGSRKVFGRPSLSAKKLANIVRTESIETRDKTSNNLQLLGLRVLEAIQSPKVRLGVSDLGQMSKLRRDCFRSLSFLKIGGEAWPRQMHYFIALLDSVIEKKTGKKSMDSHASISLAKTKKQIQNALGWRIKFGDKEILFEDAFLRINLEANAIFAREQDEAVRKIMAANPQIDMANALRDAKVNGEKIQETAVERICGVRAQQEYSGWKQQHPNGNISIYLIDLAELHGGRKPSPK